MSRCAPFLSLLARLVAGGVFVYAGAVKALAPRAFAGEVAAYGLLPHAGNLLVAATLPYVEIIAGALVLLGRKLRPAVLILLVLDLAFLALLGWAWGAGLQIDCGCFRPGGGTTLPRDAFIRDLVLLLPLLWLWLRPVEEAGERP